jgi:hypothetical protein
MTKRHNVSISTIEASLIHTFEKLHQLHQISNPNRFESASTDTGQEKSYPTDRGMEITLDMICNTIHRQLYGNLFSRAGDRFDNVKDRLDKAEQLIEAHMDRYGGDREGMSVDPRTYELAHQLDLATARFEAMKELLDGMRATIEHFTQKKWEPRPMGTGQNTTGRRIEITDEAKTAALAALAKLDAKRKGTAPARP